MKTRDVTPFFKEIQNRKAVVAVATREAVAKSCSEYALLGRSVSQILELDGSGASYFRLLPLVIPAAYNGQSDHALPVSIISRIWWAGAETLDDITDNEFDYARMKMSPAQVLIACTACLSLIPQKVADLYAPSAQIAAAWTRELMDASLRCATGQLDDLAGDRGVLSWRQTMRIYAGKTGAAYARDAAMSALIAQVSADIVSGWKAFGCLFGVLRQLANDRAGGISPDNADFANGTPTLLLAHAFEEASGSSQPRLLALHRAARNGVTARQQLIAWLTGHDLAAGYNKRIDAIGGHLAALLDRLVPASGHRDLLHWMIRVSTDQAKLLPAEPPPASGEEI